MAFCASCGKELPAGVAFCPSCGAPVQPGASAQAASSTAPVSGMDTLTKDTKAQQYWIERIVAFFIDAVIVFIVLAIIAAAIAIPFVLTGTFAPMAFFFGAFALVGGIIFVLYFTFTESMGGASLGKRIFHLKVVSKSGSNPTIGEAFIRNISKLYWLLLLLDVIVGLAISKGYQQKYSDHVMGTSVTKA